MKTGRKRVTASNGLAVPARGPAEFQPQHPHRARGSHTHLWPPSQGGRTIPEAWNCQSSQSSQLVNFTFGKRSWLKDRVIQRATEADTQSNLCPLHPSTHARTHKYIHKWITVEEDRWVVKWHTPRLWKHFPMQTFFKTELTCFLAKLQKDLKSKLPQWPRN